MLEKFKNTSLVTKLLYLLALILFVAWVIPQMSSYYSSVNSYEQHLQELRNTSSKHGINEKPRKFSEALFKKDTELLFSKVTTQPLEEKQYIINIQLKKEDLKKFHTFLDTLSL
ncbi:MAG: Unknown protein, partial [uncultured Sulfurovum sp.]